jgi:hypothetical protein
MTHRNTSLRGTTTARSTARHRVRMVALVLGAGALLLAVTAWIAAPPSASAGSGPLASAPSGPATIDVIAKTTSFRPLPGDGAIATQDLFDKQTGMQVGRDVFYCLFVQPPTSPGAQTLGECPGTATFTGKGEISILGSFLVPPSIGQSWTVAVTGGTDSYRNVRGELKVTQISSTDEEGIWTLLG